MWERRRVCENRGEKRQRATGRSILVPHNVKVSRCFCCCVVVGGYLNTVCKSFYPRKSDTQIHIRYTSWTMGQSKFRGLI